MKICYINFWFCTFGTDITIINGVQSAVLGLQELKALLFHQVNSQGKLPFTIWEIHHFYYFETVTYSAHASCFYISGLKKVTNLRPGLEFLTTLGRYFTIFKNNQYNIVYGLYYPQMGYKFRQIIVFKLISKHFAGYTGINYCDI